jgi:hypothetical protein
MLTIWASDVHAITFAKIEKDKEMQVLEIKEF